MTTRASWTLYVCSAAFACCVLGTTVLANTDMLEFIHPLAYTTIYNLSAVDASTTTESDICPEHSQDDTTTNDDQIAGNWFVQACVAIGTLLPTFLKWYAASLDSSPVLTKSLTSGLMGALGDVFAQVMEMWTMGGKWDRNCIDSRRVFSIAAEGVLVSGPLMHYSYEFLEEHLPIYAEENEGSDLYSWYMTICQVFIDMLVMDSIYVATMMTTSSVLEGRGQEIRQEMANDYIPAVKVSWFNSFCWAPVQCISFKYIPFNYRVFAINLQDIAWNASISYMAHRSRHDKKQEDRRTICEDNAQDTS